jgi:hypothetical protein
LLLSAYNPITFWPSSCFTITNTKLLLGVSAFCPGTDLRSKKFHFQSLAGTSNAFLLQELFWCLILQESTHNYAIGTL